MEERKKIKWSAKRYECPACGSKHAFARMVGESEDCGHCHSCGVTLFPKTDKPRERYYYEEQAPLKPYEVPADEFERLVVAGGFSDTLRTALVARMPAAMKSLRDYRVVSFGLETGFPLIDRGGRVHSIKIMGYGADLHRIKTAPDGQPLPAYRWPDTVVRVSTLQTIANGGGHFEVRRDEGFCHSSPVQGREAFGYSIVLYSQAQAQAQAQARQKVLEARTITLQLKPEVEARRQRGQSRNYEDLT